MKHQTKPDPRRVYTADEYVEFTGLSRGAVYNGIKSGEIPSIKIGRRVLILKEAADAQLKGEG